MTPSRRTSPSVVGNAFAATPVRRRAMAGVSLLEMVLVLALVALFGLLAAMTMSGGMEGLELRSEGRRLTAELRHARTRAIATGVPQQFELDMGHHRWRGVEGRGGELRKGLSLHYTGAREVQARADTGVIRFFEDGASTGGRIELQSRKATWRIDVGWITGEVRSGWVREEAR